MKALGPQNCHVLRLSVSCMLVMVTGATCHFYPSLRTSAVPPSTSGEGLKWWSPDQQQKSHLELLKMQIPRAGPQFADPKLWREGPPHCVSGGPPGDSVAPIHHLNLHSKYILPLTRGPPNLAAHLLPCARRLSLSLGFSQSRSSLEISSPALAHAPLYASPEITHPRLLTKSQIVFTFMLLGVVVPSTIKEDTLKS